MSTMVDSKLAKNVQKSVGRAKEKILQNLGKVDRTADEIFDEHVNNFNKQQIAATRLQKELNNYIRCIRACSAANRALMDAVSDVYEPEWGNKELINQAAANGEMLWNDFAHRLAEQVLIPLNTYQGQFPESRKKIEKRGRKLVDYDGERHALQALQSNPRRAEAKLARQRENLEAAKRTYEVLNSELHEELPGLYASRIVFLVSAMSTLFASENIFHSETAKVYTELEGIVERLSKESAKGALNFKAPSNAILNNTDSPKEDVKNSSSSTTPISSNAKPSSTTTSSPSGTKTESSSNINSGDDDTHLYVNVQNSSLKPSAATNTTTSTSSSTVTSTTETNNVKQKNSSSNNESPVLTNGDSSSSVPEPETNNDSSRTNNEKPNNNPNNAESPSSPSTGNNKTPSSSSAPLHGINGDVTDSNANSNSAKHNTSNNNSSDPEKSEIPGVLYRVRATYRYQKEDVDELSFEAGEVVNVIEYEDPEEQEEGWLMGVKENGERGMFPANFTRPL